MKTTYLITSTGMTVFINGKSYSTTKENKNWSELKSLLLKLSPLEEELVEENALLIENIKEKIIEKINPARKVINILTANNISVIIENGVLIYKSPTMGDLFLKSDLVERILEIHEQAGDIMPFINFAENLLQNPSTSAVNELYLFLKNSNIPITEDGCFMAYKKVDTDFFDLHSHTFDNSPGQTVSMERSKVNPDREQTCSTGLHVCAKSYLDSYSMGKKVILVKVNPKNVVSVPNDYNNAKMRVCEYYVVQELCEYDKYKLPDFYTSDDYNLVAETKEKEKIYFCSKCGLPLLEDEHEICSHCAEKIYSQIPIEKEMLGNFKEVQYTHAGNEYYGFMIGNIRANTSVKTFIDKEKTNNSKFNYITNTFSIRNKVKRDLFPYDRILILSTMKNGNSFSNPRFLCPQNDKVLFI